MLIIVGSRREGNSFKLANMIKDALNSERINTDIIIPGNQKIHICTGCMDCDKDGKCDYVDDMESNIERIKNNEYIILISPSRWNLLSGDLKIFIDRLNPLYSRKELKGKKLFCIAIGAKDKNLYSTESTLTSLNSFAESAGMKVILEKQFYNCLNDADILNCQDEINSLIRKIKDELNK